MVNKIEDKLQCEDCELYVDKTNEDDLCKVCADKVLDEEVSCQNCEKDFTRRVCIEDKDEEDTFYCKKCFDEKQDDVMYLIRIFNGDVKPIVFAFKKRLAEEAYEAIKQAIDTDKEYMRLRNQNNDLFYFRVKTIINLSLVCTNMSQEEYEEENEEE